MTTEQRLADIEEILLHVDMKIERLSKTSRTTFWAKPYIIPFVFGVIFGGLFVNIPAPTIPFVSQSSAKLEQQAAAGGAAIPFPSVSPSPPPSTLPPGDSTAESTSSSSTSMSEESSPNSPQADAGQTTSTRFYRLPFRRTR